MKPNVLLIALLFGLGISISTDANAGIIRIEISGSAISQADANRGLDAKPLNGYFEIDTDAPAGDEDPEPGTAQFNGHRESSHPSYVPSPPYELIGEGNPEFLDTFGLSLSTGYYNVRPLAPLATFRRLTLGLEDSADEDRISLEFVVFGQSITDTQVLRLELFGDGDSLWSGSGNPIDSLDALELLAGADLSGIRGTGTVGVSRASPYNSFSLEINSVTVTMQSVPEPLGGLLLLATFGLVGVRRRSQTQGV